MRSSVLLSMLLLGCEGVLQGPTPEQVVVTPTPDAGPEKCEPGVHEVPKLLRVSNHEYRTMVSDVLGTEVGADVFARWTPVAQVYGFDTMSETRIDAQGLEEQLASAERLAALILSTPALTAHCPAVPTAATPVCPVKSSYPSNTDFSDTQGRDCWSYYDSSGTPMIFENTRVLWKKNPDETVLIWANGAHPGPTVDSVRRWTGALDGTVTLTGRFNDADPGGGDGVVVSIRKNGQIIWTRTIPNGGEAPFTLDTPITRGEHLDFVVNRNGDPNYDSTGFLVTIGFTPTPLKAGWTWDNCVGPLVDRLASHGFRRPVRADEREDYRQLFERSRQGATAAGFEEPADEAISAVVQAVLLSPNFMFKPELVPGGLDPQERAFGVASRLSLFVRSSVADEELWNLAGTGALNDRRVVEQQARRLLDADLPRFTQNFGGQWLDFRDSEDLGPLTASMQAESAGVFSEVLAGDLPPERLLNPGFTFVDAPLAYHYGLSSGGMGNKVTTAQRGGLLSQALFLTRTATGSEFRRPIHRGLWTLTRLLCRSLPRLDAATLEEISNSVGSIDRNLPLREQMAIHRQNAVRCGGCHGMMDPIGLALEKYDRVGLWRDTYPNGAPITNDLELDGVVVGDPLQLAAAIQGSPDYRACVATKLLTFGLNRGPLASEQCVAQSIATPADGSKPTLKQMTLDALLKSLQLTEVP